MPTFKNLIKDTIALGGHYCNYSAAYIVVVKYMVVVSCYLYIVSRFDEAAIAYIPYTIICTSLLLVCLSLTISFRDRFTFTSFIWVQFH